MKLKTWLKKGKFVALILVIAVVFAACGSGSSDKGDKNTAESKVPVEKSEDGGEQKDDTTGGELKTIKIGTPGQGGILSENAQLAYKLGYLDEELEKAGYKAEYVGFPQAGPAINEAFAAKEIDYAFYNELPAMVAKSNGVDVKLIAAITQQFNYALFVTEKSGIKSVKDLEGKKAIAVQGTILYKYFADLSKQNNVDLTKVETLNALADANALLASGDADAYSCAYSSALLLKEQGLGTILTDTTKDVAESTGIALAARDEFVKQEPESAKAIIRALKRASEYASQNPDEVYKLLAAESLTEDLLKQVYAFDTTFSFFNPEISDTYKKNIQGQYEFAKENQLLASDLNVDELIDTSYVEEVLAEKE